MLNGKFEKAVKKKQGWLGEVHKEEKVRIGL